MAIRFAIRARPAGALAASLGVVLGAGCVSLQPNESPAPAHPPAPAPSTAVSPPPGVAHAGAGAALPVPGLPPAPAAPQPAPKQFQLGAAAHALVMQSRAQAAHGDVAQAQATVERALRIEPDNPLLWLELGELHGAAGQYAQANGMGHKALQLAAGDPRAVAASWRLIAESLRGENRTAEAAEAQSRANTLAPR